MEENLRLKIHFASLIVGSKFTVFALFYFVFEGNFTSTSPWGAYIWRGDLTEGFFASTVRGAHIWRGLYMEGLIFGILQYLFFDMPDVCNCVSIIISYKHQAYQILQMIKKDDDGGAQGVPPGTLVVFEMENPMDKK